MMSAQSFMPASDSSICTLLCAGYSDLPPLSFPQCSAGGCLIELAQQLAVIMIGKQVVNNAQEILVPKVKAWWHKKQVRTPGKGGKREKMFLERKETDWNIELKKMSRDHWA